MKNYAQKPLQAGDIAEIDGVRHVYQPMRDAAGKLKAKHGRPLYEWVPCGSDKDRTKPGLRPHNSTGGSYVQGVL